jgi:hypothetical protein
LTSDLDIYRTASVLIREHGDEADLVAAQRADSFLEAGDAAAVWLAATYDDLRAKGFETTGPVGRA